MPLTREQIKRQGVSDGWISPRYGDGGWHTTPGCQRFTTEWEPRNDKILIRLFDETASSLIARPDSAETNRITRQGVVLKTGPGKWIDGTWWNVAKTYFFHLGKLRIPFKTREWEWIPGHRQQMSVHPGQQVVIGQWTDWESAEAGWGENIVICQEADVRCVLT